VAQHQQASGKEEKTQSCCQGRTIIAEACDGTLRDGGMRCRNLLLTKDLFRARLMEEHFCSLPDLPN
jgi:hypothetical protein